MARKQPASVPTADQNPGPSPQVEPEIQAPQAIRKSWVWKYFVDEPKLEKVRCIAIMKKNSRPCNSLLAPDRSGSTKSMIESGLQDISVMIKKQKTNHLSKFSIFCNKKAITYLIADTNLPFAFVERKSFQELMTLMNPETLAWEICSFQEKQSQWRCTTCTSHTPTTSKMSSKTSSKLAQTWYTKKLLLPSLCLSSPHNSSHTCSSFAKVFIEGLDNYNLTNLLVRITADNASNNSTLAAR
ncbi:uncharacterized protein VP01_942g3, partial [Puccinia sorghi]